MAGSSPPSLPLGRIYISFRDTVTAQEGFFFTTMTLVALNTDTQQIDVVSRGRTEVVQPATTTPVFAKGPYELFTPEGEPPLLIIFELYVVSKQDDGSKSIDKYAAAKVSVASVTAVLLETGAAEVDLKMDPAMDGAEARTVVILEFSDSEEYSYEYTTGTNLQSGFHVDDDFEYSYYTEDETAPEGTRTRRTQKSRSRPASVSTSRRARSGSRSRRSRTDRPGTADPTIPTLDDTGDIADFSADLSPSPRSAGPPVHSQPPPGHEPHPPAPTDNHGDDGYDHSDRSGPPVRPESAPHSARSSRHGTPRSSRRGTPRSARVARHGSARSSAHRVAAPPPPEPAPPPPPRPTLPLAPPPLATFDIVSRTAVPLRDALATHVSSSAAAVRVVVFEASGLPLVGVDGSELPAAFVSLKTTEDDRTSRRANASTRAARASRRPAWGEELVVGVPEPLLAVPGEGVVLSVADSLTQTLLAKFVVPFSALDSRTKYLLRLGKAGSTETVLVSIELIPTVSDLVRSLAAEPTFGLLRVKLGRLAPQPDRSSHFQALLAVRTAARLNSGSDPALPWSDLSVAGTEVPGPLPAVPSPLGLSSFTASAWNETTHIPAPLATLTNPSGALAIQIWRAAELSRGIYDPEYYGHALVPLDSELVSLLLEGFSVALSNIAIAVLASPLPDDSSAPPASSIHVNLELSLACASNVGPPSPRGLPPAPNLGAAPIIGSAPHTAHTTAVPDVPPVSGFDMVIEPSKYIGSGSYSDAGGYSGYSYYSPRAARHVHSKTRSPRQSSRRSVRSRRSRQQDDSFDPLATTHALAVTRAAQGPSTRRVAPLARRAVTQVSLAPDVTILTNDIQNKQDMIDRLLTEVDEKASAIKTLGADVMRLRKENTMLRVQITELSTQLEDRHADALSNAETRGVDGLDHDELVRRHIALSRRYKADMRRFQENQLRVEKLQNAVIKHNEAEKSYLELEEAHTAQAAFIMQLQTENSSVNKFKQVIADQETIIARLEHLVEANGAASARARPRPPSRAEPLPALDKRRGSSTSADAAETAALRNELSAANSKIHSLQSQIREMSLQLQSMPPGPSAGMQMSTTNSSEVIQLRFRIEELTRQNHRLETDLQKVLSTAGMGELEKDRFLLLMRAETSEARAASLEAQLVENTREYGSQIAQLKAQLAMQ
ncbi:uncharacterized protein AMSG_01652 [Thecamonas trahens ATCC 50062]|uniref:C2 domain-containing protein n=1 Tax=Thecamonas trahens ATCC 50062 TaxID=461836 RepID=A0A0L0DR93_THETB|nr:hypothetical protein AMSG_01652 [Thecamonas trahens ATCC 50062]KNC54800.1 hypothetical protein AMSG_01652 [Thecamonas trahens ATCC 50062]|eukprot:XP_013761700.1 hypothetical protein AMSG_01652 [Thecamonas trahens ATCC 50062]